MVEAPKPHRCASHIHFICIQSILHLDMLWMDIWVLLHCYACAGGGGFWKIYVGPVPEWCCNVMVEAPNPLGVHPTSMSYVYNVF
jgi:hypothetical protein